MARWHNGLSAHLPTPRTQVLILNIHVNVRQVWWPTHKPRQAWGIPRASCLTKHSEFKCLIHKVETILRKSPDINLCPLHTPLHIHMHTHTRAVPTSITHTYKVFWRVGNRVQEFTALAWHALGPGFNS